MKLRYTFILLLLAGISFSQTSPSTGVCPTMGCSNNYSAAFHDPSIIDADGSLGCFSCGAISFFQFFTGAPANTEISCISYEMHPSSNGNFQGSSTHTINVYSFNSANAYNIANVNASTLLSSGSYTVDGSEVDGDIINVELGTPAVLEPGDDIFLIEFVNTMGDFYQGHSLSTGGADTYVYSPAATINELMLVSSFSLGNLLLEINGCVGPANAVPTLSQWGMIILGLILLIFGVLVFRTKNSFLQRRNAIL